MNFSEFYQHSIENPEEFWKQQAQKISWYKAPQNILSKDENDYHQWFADGELNICYLCIDKHIEDGFGEQTAIIYDSPVTQYFFKTGDCSNICSYSLYNFFL